MLPGKGLLRRFIKRVRRHERKVDQSRKEQIIHEGSLAKRLLNNADFNEFMDLLKEAEMPLLEKSLDTGTYNSVERDKFIERINQVEDILRLPSQLVKRMESLPEAVEARRKNRPRAASAR